MAARLRLVGTMVAARAAILCVLVSVGALGEVLKLSASSSSNVTHWGNTASWEPPRLPCFGDSALVSDNVHVTGDNALVDMVQLAAGTGVLLLAPGKALSFNHNQSFPCPDGALCLAEDLACVTCTSSNLDIFCETTTTTTSSATTTTSTSTSTSSTTTTTSSTSSATTSTTSTSSATTSNSETTTTTSSATTTTATTTTTSFVTTATTTTTTSSTASTSTSSTSTTSSTSATTSTTTSSTSSSTSTASTTSATTATTNVPPTQASTGSSSSPAPVIAAVVVVLIILIILALVLRLRQNRKRTQLGPEPSNAFGMVANPAHANNVNWDPADQDGGSSYPTVDENRIGRVGSHRYAYEEPLQQDPESSAYELPGTFVRAHGAEYAVPLEPAGGQADYESLSQASGGFKPTGASYNHLMKDGSGPTTYETVGGSPLQPSYEFVRAAGASGPQPYQTLGGSHAVYEQQGGFSDYGADYGGSGGSAGQGAAYQSLGADHVLYQQSRGGTPTAYAIPDASGQEQTYQVLGSNHATYQPHGSQQPVAYDALLSQGGVDQPQQYGFVQGGETQPDEPGYGTLRVRSGTTPSRSALSQDSPYGDSTL